MIADRVQHVEETLNKKVFVIGGTGFLGHNSIINLKEKGYDITTIALPNKKDLQLVDGVEYILKDINKISDTDLLKLMKGKDYMLIALGADERYTPKAPALDFFRRYNVREVRNMLRLARLAKIKRVVILGSYFTYFNRIWPELKLRETHPYIRSRVEQMEVAFTFNSNVMKVSILELPYVFGTAPKYSPLKAVIEDQLNSTKHIYYPLGGTAMATVREVAEAVEGAFLYAEGGRAYPVASVNLKWKDLLSYLLKLQGQSHKVMTPYSKNSTKHEMKKKIRNNKKNGRESGLDLVEYLKFKQRDAFLDIENCISGLKYKPDDIYKALQQTVEECQKQADKENKKTLNKK